MKRNELVDLAKKYGIKNIASKNMSKLREEIDIFENKENIPKVTFIDFEAVNSFFKKHKKLRVLYIKDECEYENGNLNLFNYHLVFKDNKNIYKLNIIAEFGPSKNISISSSVLENLDNNFSRKEFMKENSNPLEGKYLFPEEDFEGTMNFKVNKNNISCDLFTIFIPKMSQEMNSTSSLIKIKHFIDAEGDQLQSKQIIQDEDDSESEGETLSDVESDDLEIIGSDDEEDDEGGVTLGSEDDVIVYTDDEDDEDFEEGDELSFEDDTFSFESGTDEEEVEE